jgi:hypothetical protein
MVVIYCAHCPTVPAQYQQGDTSTCDNCFSLVDDMICLGCNRKRHRDDNLLMMSCPCYDIVDDDSFSEWESDDPVSDKELSE